jgi:lysylphosphatidylglycerol synthetase-like protein (DUF2156 family)
MQNNKYKLAWDLIIMAILAFVILVLPTRIAFQYDSDETGVEPAWQAIYNFIDFMFLIDIVLTFFTSYTDEMQNIEITDRKLIAARYLRGFFILDLLSIIPFDYLAQDESAAASDANSLLRIFKVGKLYKILRLVRLVKVFKMIKSQ